jgi:small subunit ribosomal protein S6
MRRYETTYILRPNLGEEQFSEIIERTNKIVKGDGGAIINLERWGSKKLAFEIKKEAFGQYVYFDYAANGSTVQEMERIFRIDDRVLRFLTVKLADAIDETTIANETERAVATAEARKAKAAEADSPDSPNVENGEEANEVFTDED